MRTSIKIIIISLILLFIYGDTSKAMDGTLDPSFNGTGTVTTLVGTSNEAFAVALQPDGKILVAGQAVFGGLLQATLIRYNTDGSLDASFNPAGSTPGIIVQLIAQVM